ncbi:MAG TPA: histidine kinase dimerization/phospho-acceptor domain-containing protein, partial [Blastocatellia bacterium]|nr:histidine kinase dimerization/phospho-acceptor domain-containing protein [Blastocatellia bacterium]
MIDAKSQAQGVALLCDQNGVILQTVRDEIGFGDRVAEGQSFIALVDGASVEKALSFMVELRSEGAAFDWVMNVEFGDRITGMHFAGGAVGGRFLIVGATSSSEVARYYEELVQINSEQVNALRSATKETAVEAREWADRDHALYDELSRLNNELATMQRELTKKNIELGKLNEQKNQFIGMAAHDLRNPLGVILTYSNFMLREAKDCLTEQHVEF